MPKSDDLDQALWLAKRQAAPQQRRRLWTPAKIERLEAMVGQCTLPEMGRELGLPALAVSVRLHQLGYSIPKDVYAPLGRNLHQAARELDIPYEWLWNQARLGKIQAPKIDGKNRLLRWPEFRRLEHQVKQHLARRARVLARIHEPTITKKQFDQMIGLSETQTQRYIVGKIVRAWKVPMKWSESTSPSRLEWRVSKQDAERVTQLRAEGKLRLRRKAFREISRYENSKVVKLRKARRLGQRDELKHALSCVVPGCFTIRQVASHVGLSESVVYTHIQSGRLPVERKRVGSRNYVAIRPEVLPAYVAWAKQAWVKKAGKPKGSQTEARRVLDAGYLTVVEACKRYPGLTEPQLRSAIQRKRIPAKHIGRMLAMKQKDVRTFVKLTRRWAEMKARANRA